MCRCHSYLLVVLVGYRCGPTSSFSFVTDLRRDGLAGLEERVGLNSDNINPAANDNKAITKWPCGEISNPDVAAARSGTPRANKHDIFSQVFCVTSYTVPL